MTCMTNTLFFECFIKESFFKKDALECYASVALYFSQTSEEATTTTMAKKKERRKRGVGTWFEKKNKKNKPRKSRVAELPLHPKDFHFWHYNDSGLEGKRVWLRQNIIIKI